MARKCLGAKMMLVLLVVVTCAGWCGAQISVQEAPTMGCMWKADVIFLLDGSITSSFVNFDTAKNITIEIVERLAVNPTDGFSIGVIMFDTTVRQTINLDPAMETKTALIDQIRVLPFSSVVTMVNTHAAINAIDGMLLNFGRGVGFGKVVVLITDSQDSLPHETAMVAEMARHGNTRFIALGIGTLPTFIDLFSITNNNRYILQVVGKPPPDQMHKIVDTVVDRICIYDNPCVGGGEAVIEDMMKLPHPRDCAKFIGCSLAPGASIGSIPIVTPGSCRFGQFWDSAGGACAPVAEAVCPFDPCMSTKLKSWGIPGLCNPFWVCTNGKTTGFACCPQGYRFDATTHSCVSDSTCYSTCPTGSLWVVTLEPPTTEAPVTVASNVTSAGVISSAVATTSATPGVTPVIPIVSAPPAPMRPPTPPIPVVVTPYSPPAIVAITRPTTTVPPTTTAAPTAPPATTAAPGPPPTPNYGSYFTHPTPQNRGFETYRQRSRGNRYRSQNNRSYDSYNQRSSYNSHRGYQSRYQPPQHQPPRHQQSQYQQSQQQRPPYEQSQYQPSQQQQSQYEPPRNQQHQPRSQPQERGFYHPPMRQPRPIPRDAGRKAVIDPGNPDPIPPDPVRRDPVRPDPVRPDPVRSDPARSHPVRPDPVRPNPVRPDPGLPVVNVEITTTPEPPTPPTPSMKLSVRENPLHKQAAMPPRPALRGRQGRRPRTYRRPVQTRVSPSITKLKTPPKPVKTNPAPPKTNSNPSPPNVQADPRLRNRNANPPARENTYRSHTPPPPPPRGRDYNRPSGTSNYRPPNQGPRDQGPRNQGPRDQGPRDQGPRNQGSHNQSPHNQGPEPSNYGPPDPPYRPPRPSTHGRPEPSNYGPPRSLNSGPPNEQNHGPPNQQNHGPPNQQNHGPPNQQNYGPPNQQNYGPPNQQNYGPPNQQNHGPPNQQNYGPPNQQNYGSPDHQNYGPPNQNYGPPDQQNHGPPRQQNYGPPSRPRDTWDANPSHGRNAPPPQNDGSFVISDSVKSPAAPDPPFGGHDPSAQPYNQGPGPGAPYDQGPGPSPYDAGPPYDRGPPPDFNRGPPGGYGGPPYDQQGYNRGPDPGYNRGPDPGYRGPDPGYNRGPDPGYNRGPDPGYNNNRGPDPGYNRVPDPGYNRGPPDPYNSGPGSTPYRGPPPYDPGPPNRGGPPYDPGPPYQGGPPSQYPRKKRSVSLNPKHLSQRQVTSFVANKQPDSPRHKVHKLFELPLILDVKFNDFDRKSLYSVNPPREIGPHNIKHSSNANGLLPHSDPIDPILLFNFDNRLVSRHTTDKGDGGSVNLISKGHISQLQNSHVISGVTRVDCSMLIAFMLVLVSVRVWTW